MSTKKQNRAWMALTKAIADWADNHMDQHEQFKLSTRDGPLYVTLSYATEYPDNPEFQGLIVP